MVIGDCEFEMSRGVTPRQLQEVACISGVPEVDWRAGVPPADEAELIAAEQSRAREDVARIASGRPPAAAARHRAAGGGDAAADAAHPPGRYQILGAISEKIVVTPNVKHMLNARRDLKRA